MQRQLEPEILDELAAEDPRAVRSRKDLQRVNWFMGNVGYIARALVANCDASPKRILELGAGDGTLLLKVSEQLAEKWKGPIDAYLLDRQDIVSEQTKRRFGEIGWTAHHLNADLLDWIDSAEPRHWDAVLCNLFAHHFSEDVLRRLFRGLARTTDLFIACEPWRNRFAPKAAPFLGLLGCSAVTRHDARVSIKAGFRDAELSNLWPKENGFMLTERRAGLFSHLFVARRV